MARRQRQWSAPRTNGYIIYASVNFDTGTTNEKSIKKRQFVKKINAMNKQIECGKRNEENHGSVHERELRESRLLDRVRERVTTIGFALALATLFERRSGRSRTVSLVRGLDAFRGSGS